MGIIARLVQIVIGVLNNGATRLFLMKVFIKSLLVVVVPYAAFMCFNAVFKTLMDLRIEALNNMNVGTGNTALQLTGLAAYLYNELGIGIGLSMLVSAYGILLLARSIPFLR